MDHIHFGAFVAQLRKEQDMTQRELAERLHVTDKAVSKWETGKGFPDLKLLEPLAQALNVSLVELIQGERNQKTSLTMAEAETVVSQAMDQSQKITARRYLRLFRWLLTGISAICLIKIFPYLWTGLDYLQFYLIEMNRPNVIGGSIGTTAIVTTPISPPPIWLAAGLPAVILLLCIILSVRVGQLERKLK